MGSREKEKGQVKVQPWYRIEEAAQRYRVSARHLRREISRKKLKAHKFGQKVVLLKHEDLEALLSPVKG